MREAEASVVERVAGFFQRASREVEGWYRKEVRLEWEHSAIAQAIGERDGDRVRAILRGHLKRSLAGKRREDITQNRKVYPPGRGREGE